MRVHFICEGNTYRSRLAEAYLKSLKIPGVEVLSSGVHADKDLNGPITPYAKLLLKQQGLSAYGKRNWNQLTQARIDKSDLVICMNRQIYQDCKESFSLPLRTFIWDIPDVKAFLGKYSAELARDQLPEVVERTFDKIRERVDELVRLIKKPRNHERLDVLNFDGSPLHKTADVDEVHAMGLWHGGVHIGLYTKDGRVVLEQRSQTIIFNPGLWDLTLGGLISAGESPEVAVQREVKEEIGVRISREQLQKLFVFRYDHYLSRYGMHSKVFVHTYIACIKPPVKFKFQKAEVADARLVPLAEAKKMIEGQGPSPLGEMSPAQHFNLRLVSAIEAELAGAHHHSYG